MAVYNGPPRGGSRGGKDQFNWDAVKGDQDREYYLGHSVKALTGRWQKGKDVYWYTREKQRDQPAGAVNDEIQAVKDREAQLMAEALGLKIPASKTSGPSLDKNEMNKLLQKTNSVDADTTAAKGLGFAAGAMGGLPAARERLPADGLPGTAHPPLQEDLPGPPPISSKRARVRDESPVRSSKHESDRISKRSKKDKRERKDKKHKREKKHSKDKKRKRKSRSP